MNLKVSMKRVVGYQNKKKKKKKKERKFEAESLLKIILAFLYKTVCVHSFHELVAFSVLCYDI